MANQDKPRRPLRGGALSVLIQQHHSAISASSTTPEDTAPGITTPDMPETGNKSRPTNTGLGTQLKESLHHTRPALVAPMEIPTEQIRVWGHHDRLAEELEDGIHEFAANIKEVGQIQPALVRPIPQTAEGHRYELIFGRRRFRACQIIKLPLKADIRAITDGEAAILLAVENMQRKEVSAYGRAMYFYNILKEEIITREQLIFGLKMTQSSFTELMVFTRMPDEVKSIFNRVDHLSVIQALNIMRVLSDAAKIGPEQYQQCLDAIKHIAERIENGEIGGTRIEAAIRARLLQKQDVPKNTVTDVKNSKGDVVGKWRPNRNGALTLTLRKQFRTPEVVDQINQLLSSLATSVGLETSETDDQS